MSQKCFFSGYTGSTKSSCTLQHKAYQNLIMFKFKCIHAWMREFVCLCAHSFSKALWFYSISAKHLWWQPESVDHCQKSTDPTVVFELKTSWHPTLCWLKCKQSCIWRLNHTICFSMHTQIVINWITHMRYRKRLSVFWVYVLVCQEKVRIHVSLCVICMFMYCALF